MGQPLRILGDKDIERIHEASLTVLEKTGIKVWEPKAVKLLSDAGANVDETTGRVRFPRELVKASLRNAPKEFTLAGRSKEHDLRLEAGKSYFGTLGTAPLIIDLETKVRRTAIKKDLINLSKIADALEGPRYFHTMVTPSDVRPMVADLHRWDTVFRHTAKHVMGGAVYNTDNIGFLIKMCQAVAGGEKELQKRPIITATECPVSPLQHDRRPLVGIMEFARNKLPAIIYSEPKAGATSPASLAGTLVVTNSEVLSGIVISQAVQPGAPVIYGSVATLMDMKTGGIAFGSPETGLLAVCTTQLARYYGLPNMTPGGRTDSKIPCDAQTGYEKMRTALMVALAGGNLGNMAGLIESNLTASYEQLIVDDEIIGSIERIAEGVDTSDDAFAEDLIAQVGPGGGYLSQRHTLDRLKKEHYIPRISDRAFYAGWQRAGGKELRDVARERAKKLISTHVPEPLDRSVEEELSLILKQAEDAAEGK
jgi:trimethylamine--corrinoid protein Co-methyltransferase